MKWKAVNMRRSSTLGDGHGKKEVVQERELGQRIDMASGTIGWSLGAIHWDPFPKIPDVLGRISRPINRQALVRPQRPQGKARPEAAFRPLSALLEDLDMFTVYNPTFMVQTGDFISCVIGESLAGPASQYIRLVEINQRMLPRSLCSLVTSLQPQGIKAWMLSTLAVLENIGPTQLN